MGKPGHCIVEIKTTVDTDKNIVSKSIHNFEFDKSDQTKK